MTDTKTAEQVVQQVTVHIADMLNERYLADRQTAAGIIASRLAQLHPLPEGWCWVVEPDMGKPGHYIPKAVSAEGEQMTVEISITAHDVNGMG